MFLSTFSASFSSLFFLPCISSKQLCLASLHEPSLTRPRPPAPSAPFRPRSPFSRTLFFSPHSHAPPGETGALASYNRYAHIPCSRHVVLRQCTSKIAPAKPSYFRVPSPNRLKAARKNIRANPLPRKARQRKPAGQADQTSVHLFFNTSSPRLSLSTHRFLTGSIRILLSLSFPPLFSHTFLHSSTQDHTIRCCSKHCRKTLSSRGELTLASWTTILPCSQISHHWFLEQDLEQTFSLSIFYSTSAFASPIDVSQKYRLCLSFFFL